MASGALNLKCARQRVGVLAVQGGFEAHQLALERLGAESRQIRAPNDLDGLDGLILPGGESTTISKGIKQCELERPIKQFFSGGGAVFGTCAGLIMLDKNHLGLMDIVATRNAFGRQVASFETDLRVEGLGEQPFRAVFIRAPVIKSYGPSVKVLAKNEEGAIAVRQGKLLACAFHPELTDDDRIHALFLAGL